MQLVNTLPQLAEKLTGSRQPIPLFKEVLAEFHSSLRQQFTAGISAGKLIQKHSAFMDEILQLAWRRFDWNERLSSWRKTRISLLAVGGYGRAELHPHSDIDLLILLEGNNYDLHRHNIQNFCTLCWDIGLEVGHSVRSVNECKTQSKNDVIVLTTLMEARTICGSDVLRQRMNRKISADKIWSPQKYFLAKRDEQEKRHEKYDHTEYRLEPNIKTSPGGLRDIQTVMWTARRKFGTVNFDDLVQQQFLTESENKVLTNGRDLLWKIRFGLHMVSGRDDDRLLFEYQRELAAMFGYQDGDLLAVEQFMKDYYRSALEVNHTNQLLLQHFEEAIIQSGKRTRIVPINERFLLHNNYLGVTSDDVFIKHPAALLEMFVIMGNDRKIQGVRAATIRLISRHVNLIDDDFRHDPQVIQYFLDILKSTYHLFTPLRRMSQYGILGAYLPEFSRIIGQMQFDLFHIYTVDAHTLQVVRNMRRFRYKDQEQMEQEEQQEQQFPNTVTYIHRRLPKVELLYIAGLYHDIAKGLGGDHSELGVNLAAAFCRRHKLGTWDTNLVCWLVKNHLVMSTTAQRKDIQNPEVIHEFALLVQDQIRLDYLFLLTVADINATNPTLWNSWRATLMRQLYSETKKVLRSGLESYVDRSDYIKENQEHATFRLTEHGLPRDKILELWNHVDEDYFIGESISNIIWQTLAIEKHQLTDGPLVLIKDDISRRRSDEGSTQIFVYMRNARRIFAAIVSALEALELDIVDARIASSASDFVFDTFTVLESNGKPVGDHPGRKERIRKTLLRYLDPDYKQVIQEKRTPRILKQFTFKTEVTIKDQIDHSILSVTARNRPGLLATIANIFAELDITVLNARITTLGERVEDVFHINKNGQALGETEIRQLITERICTELDTHIEMVAV